MNTNDLLEQRAERGVARGAAHVWADAQPAAEDRAADRSAQQPAWLFRVALIGWMAAIGLLVLAAAADIDLIETAESGSGTEEVSAEAENLPPLVSSDPLPDPILVNNMAMTMVMRPSDSGFDGDDLLGAPAFESEPFAIGFGDPATGIVVFANPDDPFNNAILGLETFEGGGFRPWSANITADELKELTNQLVVEDGEWTMPASSGMVEVSRYDGDITFGSNGLKFGWQFDFAAGADRVTLQAETVPNQNGTGENGADVWLWMARTLRGKQPGVQVSGLEVLGHDGVQLDESREIFWSNDGFVYRLLAATIEGDRSVSQDATEAVDRLSVVDRRTWVDAVKAAEGRSVAPVSGAVAFVLLIVLAASLVLFLIKQRWPSAAIVALTVIAGVALGASDWTTPAIALTGLVLAWWAYRRAGS